MLSGLLAMVLLSGTGCAFINVTVRPPPLLEAEAAAGQAGPPVVVVVPFTDARPQKGRGGMVKN
ncbi:MAG TPA: hypothetical protein VK420_03905, partial [Longimicrobium sp.]|nr:hypothetical protein [Longimicrobium sp.]